MREILFKAKRIDNGEWVEGYIAHYPTGEWRIQRKCNNAPDCDPMWQKVLICYEVESNTLCQYTGLTDKNGLKIWENDICDRKERFPEIVKMQRGDWTLDYGYAIGKEDCYCNLGFYVLERKSVEVIGNIFDNPELLEAADE